MQSLSILLLEDSPLDADLSVRALQRAGLVSEVTRVDNRRSFLEKIGWAKFDVILADFALPDFDGISALEIARQKCPDVPFIIALRRSW